MTITLLVTPVQCQNSEAGYEVLFDAYFSDSVHSSNLQPCARMFLATVTTRD